jgi:hypothetical protein
MMAKSICFKALARLADLRLWGFAATPYIVLLERLDRQVGIAVYLSLR